MQQAHVQSMRVLETTWQDLVFATRGYLRSPGFTFIALLAVALGVGANTAVFSVVDRVLFRPLPYRNADRLVSLGMVARVVGADEFLFAADYKDIAEEQNPFQSMTSWSGVNDCDITDRSPVRQRCAEVAASFLPVLGIQPILGRTFGREDEQPNAPRKVILSYGVWKSRYGSNPEIVGRTLSLDGEPARITGVLPPSFELPTLQHADLLVPQVILPAGWQHSATRVLSVYGRLKDGLTIPEARVQMEPTWARILSFVPAPFRKEVQFRFRPLRDREMQNAKTISWTLLGAVCALLLIACANVANLLLARGTGRQTELAVRTALGAVRARLVRQLMIETLLLAVVGGAFGCVVATATLRILLAATPDGMPYLAHAGLDSRVLVFSLIISLAAGLLFGLAPALQPMTGEALGNARYTARQGPSRMKHLLLAAQIAVSVMLLAAASLLVRSLRNIQGQSLGMDAGHVVAAQMVLPASRYKTPEQRFSFFNDVEQQLSGIPSVRALGLSDSLPPGGWERSRPLSSIAVQGQPREQSGTGGLVAWRYVSPGYFSALHVRLLEGQLFAEEQRTSGETHCILSRSLAKKLFPGQNALGQHLRFGPETQWATVVGIAADVKNAGLLAHDDPEYYILRAHSPDDTYLHSTGPVAQRTLSIVLRSSSPSTAVMNAIRLRIGSVDPTLPVEFQTMAGRLSDETEQPRFNALLLVLFAAIGLLLAATGLYGTVAFLVSQRTSEIGIRMSLGATPLQIGLMMLAHSGKWTLIGACAGVLGALAATRVLSSLLFGVSAHDPLTLVFTVSLLFVVALLGTIAPALRAASVDPMQALRN